MSAARTEQPTPKRLRDARLRGEVAVSRELTSAVALVAALAVVSWRGRGIASALARFLAAALARASSSDVAPRAALHESALQLGAVTLGPLVAIGLAAACAGALQTRGLWSPSAVAPRWSRISVGPGLGRLVSTSQLGLAAAGLSKAVAVALLAWLVRDVLASAAMLVAAAGRASGLAAIARAAGRVAFPLAGLLVALGAADLVLVRRRHLRRLRMTRDEVRREQKEQDGDPQHKAERRRVHRAIAAAMPVSAATCVVVNPTHLAVALHHDVSSDGAPVVVAKGSGEEAERIRAEARRAAVPVVQDVPLARALFRLADIGDEIPEELYQAAAAVLIHVHGAVEGSP